MGKRFWIFMAVYALCLILFISSVGYIGHKALNKVQEAGLKSIVSDIWEGENKEMVK